MLALALPTGSRPLKPSIASKVAAAEPRRQTTSLLHQAESCLHLCQPCHFHLLLRFINVGLPRNLRSVFTLLFLPVSLYLLVSGRFFPARHTEPGSFFHFYSPQVSSAMDPNQTPAGPDGPDKEKMEQVSRLVHPLSRHCRWWSSRLKTDDC